MKQGYHCPACGNRDAYKLLLTTLQGKSLSLLLASQATINLPQARITCLECRHIGTAADFRKKKETLVYFIDKPPSTARQPHKPHK